MHVRHVLLLFSCLLLSVRPATGAMADGTFERAPQGTVSMGGVPTSGTTFAGSQRILVRSENGALYLAYAKSVQGFDQVFVARSIDDGLTWVDFPQISSGPTKSSNPDLVIDRKGRLRVIWTKQVPAPGGAPAAGQAAAQGSEPPVVDEALAQKAAGKPDKGNGVSADDDEDYGVIRQLFESSWNGTSWTGQRQLTYGKYNGFPASAFDSHGTLHMVWYGYDGDLYQVMYSRLRGERWDEPFQVSVGYPDSINPTIAVDSRDNIHAAWYQYSQAVKSYKISYRELSASGAWGAQEQLSSAEFDTALNVTMAVDRQDRVYVAWEGTMRGTEGSSIWMRVKENGRWGAPLEVAPGALGATEPSLAIDGADRVYVFFQSARDGGIHAARVQDGVPLPGETLGGQTPGAYPNARWSFGDSRLASRPGEIDYAWTESRSPAGAAAGDNFIRVGTLVQGPNP